jgi:hypothetical protein
MTRSSTAGSVGLGMALLDSHLPAVILTLLT